MLFKTLKILVAKRMTEDLREKIDTLYALGRLTDEQYKELINGVE